MACVSQRQPVARLWAGETAVILASGPSLTPEDVDFVRGKARVLAINNCWELAPWCDALWACDARWWKFHASRVKHFHGLKFSLDTPPSGRPADVHLLRKTGPLGLETDPTGLKHGFNGGHQALNLAYHLGANPIILSGFDMKRAGAKQHWHKEHPWHVSPNYAAWARGFEPIAHALAKRGVRVINCSIETALTCFERMPLRQALPAREVAA